jgi:hypothetical protein
MAEQETPYSGGQIVATAARDFRWKRYVLVAILLIYGGMSIRDGFVKYPQDNAAWAQIPNRGDIPPHPGFDVQLNQILGMILPPLSLLFLFWTLFISRGSYRFDGSDIHVPGHPPIPLTAVRELNRAKWDRKGIAYVEYQLPGSPRTEKFKLDDFIYQREPTDRIFAMIESALGTGSAETPGETQPSPESAG